MPRLFLALNSDVFSISKKKVILPKSNISEVSLIQTMVLAKSLNQTGSSVVSVKKKRKKEKKQHY